MKKTSKSLQDKISEATKGIKCPIHSKLPEIKVNTEREEVAVICCCPSFKMDVEVVTNKVLRAWKLHGEHLRAKKEGRYN
ncbi:MAG: hypothetical protein SFY56_04585 [Bacteroidota bacterium]|nr:hypothetical protein [Bacteroidota bacterium]